MSLLQCYCKKPRYCEDLIPRLINCIWYVSISLFAVDLIYILTLTATPQATFLPFHSGFLIQPSVYITTTMFNIFFTPFTVNRHHKEKKQSMKKINAFPITTRDHIKWSKMFRLRPKTIKMLTFCRMILTAPTLIWVLCCSQFAFLCPLYMSLLWWHLVFHYSKLFIFTQTHVFEALNQNYVKQNKKKHPPAPFQIFGVDNMLTLTGKDLYRSAKNWSTETSAEHCHPVVIQEF